MSLPLLVRRHIGRHAARVRRSIARHPWIRWFVLATCCAGFVLSVTAHRHDVDTARAAWGTSRQAWVVAADTAAGEPVTAEAVDVPAAIVPATAQRDDPTGTTARHALAAGEIVVAVDVAPSSAPGALMPDGWLAVAVAEPTPSGAEVGEQVVVAADGIVIAADALVVATIDGTPLVAVPAADAPLVALATDTGVTLLRAP